MTPTLPTEPISHAHLVHLVERDWESARRISGLGPAAGVLVRDGRLIVSGDDDAGACAKGIRMLLDMLEGRYLVVDRIEARALGWAMVPVVIPARRGAIVRGARLAAFEPFSDERQAWDDRVLEEQQARARVLDWPGQLVSRALGAIFRDRAAYPRAGR